MLGGVVALLGAFIFGELAARNPWSAAAMPTSATPWAAAAFCTDGRCC